MFGSSVFERKYSIWTTLIQKLKTLRLSENLVPRVIQICLAQWCCSLFHFPPQTIFLDKFGPKNKIASLSGNSVPRLIRIGKIQR